MIKLIKILSELQIANPNITAEKVADYYWNNIFNNDIEFSSDKGWKEYIQICKPYMEKYGIDGFIEYNNFKQLSKSDLIKIYKEMRVLVQKYS